MSGDWERGKDISLFCGSTALSVGDGYHMMLERGTKNFEVDILLSGNQRKFASLLNCALLALPVAGRNSKSP